MELERSLPVKLTSLSGRQSSGSISIHSFSSRERIGRFFLTFGAWMLFSLLMAAIPLLHFLLVPVAVFIGIVHASIRSADREVILGGSGQCPDCRETFSIARRRYSKSFSELCDGCGRHVSAFIESPGLNRVP